MLLAFGGSNHIFHWLCMPDGVGDEMKLLDLFCCAGGAAMGYHRAGFEVVGVDIKHQPHYPFPFILGDAVDILIRMLAGEKFLASDGNWYGIDDFDAIHASPPCQAYTAMQNICKNGHNHPDLVEPIRKLLINSNKPFVIENVIGAPIRIDLLLCGSMFGLKIIRHRIFESNIEMPILTPTCHHDDVYDPWHKDGVGQREKLLKAMKIDWFMTRPEVREAIPPAFTEFIGKHLIEVLNGVQPLPPQP